MDNSMLTPKVVSYRERYAEEMKRAVPCHRCGRNPPLRLDGLFTIFCQSCFKTVPEAERYDEIAAHGFLPLAIDEWNRLQKLAAAQ